MKSFTSSYQMSLLYLILELAQNKHNHPHLNHLYLLEGVTIEIAKAVIGALSGELFATAENAPMVPPVVLSELAPYVLFAEKLDR
ncbi:hypothetical protein KY290_013672 [Solanum tuberosum]|uniref:Uncharacterized protein n=1 Tax=Solanum tuberosum TaxID=4113 RepID=A0ABQ7VMF3_SOLTU|nr:hypothetical protein KY289_013796 [Solanum tuberosum]KAH0769691.1 hypothetical protein KY290_013672 [Solanum tuberosum]